MPDFHQVDRLAECEAQVRTLQARITDLEAGQPAQGQGAVMTHRSLLDTLAVQPHPLEVERQRVEEAAVTTWEAAARSWELRAEQAEPIAAAISAFVQEEGDISVRWVFAPGVSVFSECGDAHKKWHGLVQQVVFLVDGLLRRQQEAERTAAALQALAWDLVQAMDIAMYESSEGAALVARVKALTPSKEEA